MPSQDQKRPLCCGVRLSRIVFRCEALSSGLKRRLLVLFVKGLDSGLITVPGCKAATVHLGRAKLHSMASVFSTILSAAFEAR